LGLFWACWEAVRGQNTDTNMYGDRQTGRR
jgi:hypothetical protein